MVELFGDETQTITIRMNGGIHKNSAEFELEYTDRGSLSLKYILKEACKRFGDKSKHHRAKLYNKKGIEMVDTDMDFVQANDIFYVAIDGEDFLQSAVLDDYVMGKKIGQGGFGVVYLGTHRESGKQVAIKFMDVSEFLSSASSVQNVYKEA